ncbi:hypothetical protein [Halomonas sp. BC04]|uniref:hypothetical protein n=1 Tax=Halomonas sp. BC04 TaxID=1403540 RepID=UPI0003ED7BE9|nr:hypothetical protein [Halomonas sp. BC04]EWG99636.1 hypothetical protein Q427_23740 [Halomonas sp. BC04]
MHLADGLNIPSLVLFVHSEQDLANWHSVHPLSVNLMAEPGVPTDVNRLDWERVEEGVERFSRAVAMPRCEV